MIITLILKLILAVINGLIALLPSFDPPGWLANIGTAAGTVASSLSGTSSWLPWSALFVAVAAVMGCYLVSGGIRLVRIIASFVTLGGGA